jgi:hypothetical protein
MNPAQIQSCDNPSQNRREIMTSVHDVTYDLLRRHSITTMFGNPGSNELLFLEEFPADLLYFLGLHEGIAVGHRPAKLAQLHRPRRNSATEAGREPAVAEMSRSAPARTALSFWLLRNVLDCTSTRGVTIGEDSGGMRFCARCKNCRWVREAHPVRPWDGPHACGCGARSTAESIRAGG